MAEHLKTFKLQAKRLLIALPVALALIFLMLYFTFNSVKQATLIYSAIPMSAIGGVFALLIRDMPFSISAGVGFIALFGVAVLNGIVLIGTFNQLEKEGMSDIIERIKTGTKMRLRPVLMTATVASLGFLPMALSHGAGAEVQRPLATVVIGGLLSATFLTLFILPLLYLIFYSGRKVMIGSAMVIAIFCLSTFKVNAQQNLSLPDAINKALKDNLEIQSEQLNIKSSAALKKSVFELPKTEIQYQYGQYNSINKDNGLSIQQNIPFPTVYLAKAGLYKAEFESAELKGNAKINEVKTRIRSLFYQMQYLQNVNVKLNSLDSLYSNFVSASEVRYKSGESNLLEKATAESKRGQLTILKTQYEREYSEVYLSLKSLLNQKDEFVLIPEPDTLIFNFTELSDSSLLNENPQLKLIFQEALIAEKTKQVESANVLPEFSIGYNNQSIIGFQNENGSEVYYDSDKRFTGFNFGVNIPLTFFSSSSRIKSYKFRQQSLVKEAEKMKTDIVVHFQNALNKYEQSRSVYSYYRSTGLNNSDVVINTANVGLKSGEIGYIEYLNALQTATEIQLAYLNAVNQMNQSVINLNYLLNK